VDGIARQRADDGVAGRDRRGQHPGCRGRRARKGGASVAGIAAGPCGAGCIMYL